MIDCLTYLKGNEVYSYIYIYIYTRKRGSNYTYFFASKKVLPSSLGTTLTIDVSQRTVSMRLARSSRASFSEYSSRSCDRDMICARYKNIVRRLANKTLTLQRLANKIPTLQWLANQHIQPA